MGNQFGEAVGPFNHRNAVAKKVIIEAKPRDGLLLFQAKKIEMVNRHSAPSIFVHDGKRGAGHIGAASHPRDETFDEYRFTASQVSFESQNRSDADLFRELPADRLRFSWAVGNERSHLAILDFRFSVFD